MPVRDSMADLISRVRTLVGDPAGEDQKFDDQTYQDTLDGHRIAYNRANLDAVSSVSALGVTSYTDYIASDGWWEDDVLLQDGSYTTLTEVSAPIAVTSADLRTGQWSFNTSISGPILITGKSYDLYAAAVEILDMWLATIKEDYDFLSSGRTFKRSQAREGLKELRNTYAGRTRIHTGIMVRTDMNVGGWYY